MTIEPENRMTYEEFFYYVFNDNFMNNMEEIKKIIKEQIAREDPNENKNDESFDENKNR